METVKASEIMTTEVISATPDMTVVDVMRLLLRWHISGMPVVDESGKLVGVVTEYDLVNLAISGSAADTTVEEVMSTDVEAFGPDTLLCELARVFSTKNYRRVPIVDDNKVVGIVSRRDILREMLNYYNQYQT
jgi:tRNA nucleotidyltransferase (CCA-adding enzyme)